MPARYGVPVSTRTKRKLPPFPFVVEALSPLQPEIRPMFSGFAVYVGEKIVLMLRNSSKQVEDNGLWLVLSESVDPEDVSMRWEFPSLRPIGLLGGKIQHWRLIPADSASFEFESLHACELLLRHDPRIGRIPESRRSGNKKPRRHS